MSTAKPQTFANHTRFDPPFHFFLVPVALITLIWVCYNAYKNRTVFAHWEIIVGIALVVAILRMRIYSLKLQDRVIRLEERLRLSSLLPTELRPRIGELDVKQLTALRFCSDQELPALAKRALDENLSNKDIKRSIIAWRADDHRI